MPDEPSGALAVIVLTALGLVICVVVLTFAVRLLT